MPAKGANVQLDPAEVLFLAKRGAYSQRGGGDLSRSAVLRRLIQSVRILLEDADPRKQLDEKIIQTVIALLPEAWLLKPLEIKHLEGVLPHADRFKQILAEAGLEPDPFLKQIAGLSFFEKFALVDLAVQEHAPAAGGTRPE